MDVSAAMHDFLADLREHDASDEVVIMLFSEFGRRVRDNGTGTDHGAAGVAFAIGDRVNGGMYGTYPSLKPGDLTQGDLAAQLRFPWLLLQLWRKNGWDSTRHLSSADTSSKCPSCSFKIPNSFTGERIC